MLIAGPGVEPVAALFHLLGSGGVIIEDPKLTHTFMEPVDEDKAPCCEFSSPGPYRIKAYIHEERELMEQIKAGLNEVQRVTGCGWEMHCSEVRDEDWQDGWKKYYHTFRVGQRLVIKPSWEESVAGEDDVVIEIDPGMAFGTGTHASTRFCLMLIEQYVEGGEKVVDAGCGSGILSLAAAKLGAAEIVAIDIDSVAVKIATQNVILNNLEDKIKVYLGDICTDIAPQPVDLLLANLTADVILPWLPAAVRALKPSGLLFASGIQDRRWPELKQAMERNGLVIEQVLFDADWVGVAARRN